MFLKQSTAVTVKIGPFLDATDGVTEETGLAGNATEISKSPGAAFGAGPTLGTHDAEGWYPLALTGTHTDTVGRLVVKSHDSATHLPVWHEFYVLEEAVYDDLFAASADPFTVMQSDVAAIHSQTTVIESDTAVIESDTTAIHSDTTIIASDVVQIYSDTTIVVSDTTSIHSQTTVIESDSIIIESSVQVAESNTVVIESDTIVIESSVQVAESNTVVLESDSIVIESSIQVVESQTTVIESDSIVIESSVQVVEAEPYDRLIDTTIATLASQTSFTLTAGSTDDDAYNNALIIVRDASTANQLATGTVSDYTGSTKTVTLSADPAVFTMAVGDTVEIYGKIAAAAGGTDWTAGERATILSDLAAIHSDTTIVVSDTIIIESSVQVAESNTVVIESDTIVIESSVQVAESNTVVLESDSIVIESSVQVIETDINSFAVANSTVSGTPTTTVFDTGLTAADDIYNDLVIVFTSGTQTGAARPIQDYANASGRITLDSADALPGAPSAGDAFYILAIHVHPISQIADGVWDEAKSGHTAAGSFGSGVAVVQSDTTVIESDTTAIHSDTTIIASDVVQVYSDTTILVSDTTAIHSQTTVIESDSIIVESSVQVVESDVVQVYSDTTVIASDVVQVYSDTTILVSDTTAIHSQTTVIESDSIVVESSVQVAESNTVVIESDVALLEGAGSLPGQEAPSATASPITMISYLYKAWRNKSTQTATTYSLYADDTTTVDQKATVSDDATTFTREEVGTGP